MVGMIVQDMPAYFTIHKILKKAKVKDKHAMPLAIALSYGMSFAVDEENPTIFIPSEFVSNLKHILNVLPDTPEDQLTDDVFQMLEGWGGAKVLQGLVPALKFIKRNTKAETVTDITRLLATGTIAGATVAGTKAKGEEIPQIPEPININEKPTIDVSEPKLLETNMLNALPAFFKSEGGRRVVAGISAQVGDLFPSLKKQLELAKPLINLFKKDKNVFNYKVDDSFGKFQSLERNLDVEALVSRNYDKNKLFRTAVNLAEKNNQESVFISEQVIKGTPGSNVALQINFDVAKNLDDVKKLANQIEDLTQIQGFTFKTKLLDMKEPIVIGAKGSQSFKGFRSHFIPEYSDINEEQFIERIMKLDNVIEKGELGSVTSRLEYYKNSIINKKDYGKFK